MMAKYEQVASLKYDARIMGNLSWLINHSCVPMWKLKQELTRVAIVAINYIPPGEFLSYNYKSDIIRSRTTLTCKCGSSNCEVEMFSVIGNKLVEWNGHINGEEWHNGFKSYPRRYNILDTGVVEATAGGDSYPIPDYGMSYIVRVGIHVVIYIY